MIADRGGTTALSHLPAARGMARTAGPQFQVKERGDPRAPARGRRATPPGQATAPVVGGSGGVRGADPAAVPGLPAASDRHTRHDLAVAPGPGQATLDPAPPPHRRPSHGTRTAPVGSATSLGELLLGLPADPRRTRRARLPDCGEHGVVDPEASRHRPRTSSRWPHLATIPGRPSTGHSRHRLLLRRHAAAPAAVCTVLRGARHPACAPSGSHREPERSLGCSPRRGIC